MSGWWNRRRQDKQPWKQKPRDEIRAIFAALVDAASRFSGANGYEAAIANLNGASAQVIVAVIDRDMSDTHLGEAFTAWAATRPLVERLSALQQGNLMPPGPS